jgi:hypothetical protein
MPDWLLALLAIPAVGSVYKAPSRCATSFKTSKAKEMANPGSEPCEPYTQTGEFLRQAILPGCSRKCSTKDLCGGDALPACDRQIPRRLRFGINSSRAAQQLFKLPILRGIFARGGLALGCHRLPHSNSPSRHRYKGKPLRPRLVTPRGIGTQGTDSALCCQQLSLQVPPVSPAPRFPTKQLGLTLHASPFPTLSTELTLFLHEPLINP